MRLIVASTPAEGPALVFLFPFRTSKESMPHPRAPCARMGHHCVWEFEAKGPKWEAAAPPATTTRSSSRHPHFRSRGRLRWQSSVALRLEGQVRCESGKPD